MGGLLLVFAVPSPSFGAGATAGVALEGQDAEPVAPSPGPLPPELSARRSGPTWLDYSSTEGCPSPGEFRLLYSRYVLVKTPLSVRNVAFRFERPDALFSGSLVVAHRGSGIGTGGHWMRELRGPECAELLQALMMSLSIYLESLTGTVPSAAPALEESTIGDDARLWDDNGRPTVKLLPVGAAQPVTPPSRRGKSIPWGLQPSGEVAIRWGLLPEPSWAGAFGLDVRGLDQGFGAALFGVGFDFANDWMTASGGERWLFRWWTASGSVCPVGYQVAPWLHLLPCASAHLGAYEATAPKIDRDVTSWLGYWELTGRALFRWSPLVAQFRTGVQGPMDLSGTTASRQLYDQRAGLVIGLSLGLMPDAWVFR